jgi:sugar lactone lactonase YvrE
MQAGQKEVLVKELPGFPDGITTAADGNFWVGLVVPKMPIVDWLESRRAHITAHAPVYACIHTFMVHYPGTACHPW